MKVKSCCNCGTFFEIRGNNHKYCSFCSDKTRNEKVRDRMRRYRERQKVQSLILKGVMKLCTNCGDPFEVNSPTQKYCVVCSENIRKLNQSSYDHNYYITWKDMLREPIGTSWLSGNPKSDFKDEYQIIQRELNRLGIRYR